MGRPNGSAAVARVPALVLGLVLALACAAPPPATPRFDSPRPAGALEVRLFFGEEADLDLFVTDPREEALYFGNNPTIGGGRLDVDRRCGDAAPRRERARFVAPRPGRYRVGVSYDRSCRFRRGEADFRLEVEADGLAFERRGTVAPGAFEPIVLEFDFSPAAPRPDEGPRPAPPQAAPSPAAAIRSSTSESSARASRP